MDGGWVSGSEGWAVRGGRELLPGGLPGPAGRQVQREAAGGAGEPAGDGDELGADRAGGALAWKVDARAPAVRVRLNAIVAQTSHALLAQKCLVGRCASGPFSRSAMTCSTIACARWAVSAASIGSGLLVNTA